MSPQNLRWLVLVASITTQGKTTSVLLSLIEQRKIKSAHVDRVKTGKKSGR